MRGGIAGSIKGFGLQPAVLQFDPNPAQISLIVVLWGPCPGSNHGLLHARQTTLPIILFLCPMKIILLFYLFIYFYMIGTKSRASQMRGRCFITKLYHQSLYPFSLSYLRCISSLGRGLRLHVVMLGLYSLLCSGITLGNVYGKIMYSAEDQTSVSQVQDSRQCFTHIYLSYLEVFLTCALIIVILTIESS